MANTLRFEVDTEAPYSDEEKIDLLEAFWVFVRENDADVIEDSEKLEVIDKNDIPDDSEKIRTEAIELIRNGTLTMSVVLADDSDEMLFDTGDVPIAL